jgi:hypothetical protein
MQNVVSFSTIWAWADRLEMLLAKQPPPLDGAHLEAEDIASALDQRGFTPSPDDWREINSIRGRLRDEENLRGEAAHLKDLLAPTRDHEKAGISLPASRLGLIEVDAALADSVTEALRLTYALRDELSVRTRQQVEGPAHA